MVIPLIALSSGLVNGNIRHYSIPIDQQLPKTPHHFQSPHRVQFSRQRNFIFASNFGILAPLCRFRRVPQR
jgi:hypothetical protein